MAEGRREYTAIFSIGGRLLASFGGTMAKAQARLGRLQAFAGTVMRGLRRMALLAASAFGTIFGAGMTAGAIVFGKVIRDAAGELEEAEGRARRLRVLFMQNEKIRKGGIPLAEKQIALLSQQTQLMHEQGFMSQDMLDNMVVQLAVAGMSPKKISEALGPMADVLATAKDLAVTEEDAMHFAEAWSLAIKTGYSRTLRTYGMILSNPQQKAFMTLVKSGKFDEAHRFLLTIAKTFGGANKDLLDKPGAAMKKLNQELGEMSERIGQHIVPAQDAMARAWTRALPSIEPALVFGIQQVGKVAQWAARQVTDFLNVFQGPQQKISGQARAQSIFTGIPGLGKTPVAPVSPMGPAAGTGLQAWNDFLQSVKDLGFAMGVIRSEGDSIGKILGEFLVDQIKKMTEEIRELNRTLKGLKWQWDTVTFAFETWGEQAAPKLGLALGNMAAKLQDMADAFRKFKDEIINFSIPPWLKWVPGFSGFPSGRGWMGGGAAGGAAAGVGALGNAAGGIPVQVRSYGGPQEPGQRIGSYNNRLGMGDVAISPNLMGILGKPGPDNYVMLNGKRYHVADASYYSPGVPTSNMVEIWGHGNDIATQGVVQKAYARGGIVSGITRALLGEHGSEAVIPLSGGRRSLALLDYAARRMGLSGIGGAGATSLTFAPNITINGNATEAEQRAMDSRLRDLADDFIRQFSQAQFQQRRLSYEGGYL